MSGSDEVQVDPQEDYLSHYGVPGMKWGKRRAAARSERNSQIQGARSNQARRQSELSALTAKRLTEKTRVGKAKIDDKIADKQFEIKHSPDARMAAKLTSGEKWMQSGKIAVTMGLAVTGLGAVNNAIGRAGAEGFVKGLNEGVDVQSRFQDEFGEKD